MESRGTTDPEKASPAFGLAANPDRVTLEQSTQAGDWSGPDDLDDPQNWGIAKKTYHSMIPSIYCFTVYVAIFCSL
jgi:hypothetical protein